MPTQETITVEMGDPNLCDGSTIRIVYSTDGEVLNQAELGDFIPPPLATFIVLPS